MPHPLTVIFNVLLAKRYFPVQLKKSQVVPVFKSVNKQMIENYRRLYKLSTMSKVFKSVVYDYLLSPFRSQIIPEQHGFSPG